MRIFDRRKNQKTNRVDNMPFATAENSLLPGVGRMPFPAFRGKGPYLFVSYAHKDSDIVFPEIKRFNEQGYYVWYDEGISPGNEWTDEIADALSGCSLFIAMMTPHAANSQNVQNEINYAIDEKKPFVAIHLAETNLHGGLKLQIGTKQAILKYGMTENEYVYKYTSAFERLGMRSRNIGQTAFPQPVPTETEPIKKASAADDETAQRRYMQNEIERIQNSEATTDDFEWIGSAVKAYHGIKKRFTIPGRATKIMSYAFKNRDFIEQVILPESVNELGADAFYACQNLKLAVIENDNVTFAETGAFTLCPKLTVQCRKNSVTQKNLQKTFSGEITFITDTD